MLPCVITLIEPGPNATWTFASSFNALYVSQTIEEIRKISPDTEIEILTPDFKGDKNALNTIIKANPEVFNHNIETVENLFKIARPQGNYRRSLDVLKYIKDNSNIPTKSGLMVGLGESENEIMQTLKDLREAGCNILTIGQYIQPSKQHLEVAKYYTEKEFEHLKELAKQAGFEKYQIAPLVRSSYNAFELFN